jgi:hypothetical protein
VFRNKTGKVMVIPSLITETKNAKTTSEPAASPALTIGRITLKDGLVELFDATAARPYLKIRLEQIQGDLQDLEIPSLNNNNRFELTGVLKGIRQDGRVDVAGWANISSKDSSVKLQLRSVDLVALQPYLTKASDTGVQNNNRIALNFVLEGDINNPKFTLREAFAQRLAVSMADSLKVNIGGVVKGAGSLGEKGVETATGVVKGIGGAVQGLFGERKK